MAERLADRVKKLEQRVRALQARKGPRVSAKARAAKVWSELQPFLVNLIPSLILFAAAYLFLEQVKREHEERKLTTDSVKEVRDLVRQLLSDDLDPSKANATAIAIAAFGRYSVVPLLSVLEAGGGPNRIAAAQRGLVVAGTIDRAYTCQILVDVLDNRFQRYTVTTHRQVLRTTGQVGCIGPLGANGEQALDRYRDFLNSGSLADSLSGGGEQPEAISWLKDDLAGARKLLRLDRESARAPHSH
jgi:hypothetical protein